MSLISFILMLALLLSAPVCAAAICEDDKHIFSVELVQAATGDTDGLRRYTCDICGYSYDEAIPATGHHWGEWITDAEPGCIESGHRHCICQDCEEVQSEELHALGHDYTREETPPTCTDNGTITYICSRCGDSYTEDGAPAAGHSYELGQAQDAGVGRDGWREYTCTACGDSYRVAIPALPDDTILPVETDTSVPTRPEASTSVEPALVEPKTMEPEPAEVDTVDTNDSEPMPGSQITEEVNTMDVVFACGIATTAAGFSLLSAPYIKVISWGKKKKREIDSRRREQ